MRRQAYRRQSQGHVQASVGRSVGRTTGLFGYVYALAVLAGDGWASVSQTGTDRRTERARLPSSRFLSPWIVCPSVREYYKYLTKAPRRSVANFKL